MTLILGMSKPEGIYLSVDFRVTDARTRRVLDDSASKSLTIHYPPLDACGPKVLLGFTGVAVLRDGTSTLAWIRESLRGEADVIDASMALLLERLNRDVAGMRQPLIIDLLVLEPHRRLFGAFTNVAIEGDIAKVKPEFAYHMTELTAWWLFGNGSGAQTAIRDGQLDRLRPQLDVVPRSPRNHMNLLASVNRRVSARDSAVSPFCQVTFVPGDDRFQPMSQCFTVPGESVPVEMNVLLAGIDVSEIFRGLLPKFDKFRNGMEGEFEQPSTDEMNRRLKRRD